MRKIFLVFTVVMFAFFSLITFAQDSTVPLNKIVAVVNNDVITQTQLDSEVALFKAQMQGQESEQPAPPDSVLQQQVLTQLVNRSLQLQLAKANKIQLTPEEFQHALQQIAKQNNKTVTELLHSMESIGWSAEAFKNELKLEILVQKIQAQAVSPKIIVTPEEISEEMTQLEASGKYGAQYHVSDILVPVSDNPTAAEIKTAESKADAIVKKINSGASFDSFTPNDLGTRAAGDFPQIFADPIRKLKVGAISAVIKTPNGFHILKLLDKSEKAKMPSEDEVQQMVFMKKFPVELKKFIDQLREQAYIKIML